jgi:Flp pilus assembly protein TadB
MARWLRRFLVGAGLAALAAVLLSLIMEPSLALAVGLAGVATGAVLAFGRRRDAPGVSPADASGPDRPA